MDMAYIGRFVSKTSCGQATVADVAVALCAVDAGTSPGSVRMCDVLPDVMCVVLCHSSCSAACIAAHCSCVSSCMECEAMATMAELYEGARAEVEAVQMPRWIEYAVVSYESCHSLLC
jgi:hypothetical protein